MARRKTKQNRSATSQSTAFSQKNNVTPVTVASEGVAEAVTPNVKQDTEVQTTTIRPADFLEKLSELAPEITEKLNRSEQLVLIRAIFGSIAQRLNEQEVGKLVVNYLGTFHIRLHEKADDSGSIQHVRRLAFRPKVVQQSPKS